VHVDESGGEATIGAVDLDRARVADVTDGDDSLRFDGDVTHDGLGARAVEDLGAAEDDIVRHGHAGARYLRTRQRRGRIVRGAVGERFGQMTRTFCASSPFRPRATSNSTR